MLTLRQSEDTGYADHGSLRLVASPQGELDSVTIYADAEFYLGLFDDDERAKLALEPTRKAYITQV